ncbi:MAG: hypothetical protein OXB84_08490, partial [Halobacteriovoraceae bacterium]|nr:hypothetical protein [Halobacteriovoraceae bacterium]
MARISNPSETVVLAGSSITLDATTSMDSDATDSLSYIWRFVKTPFDGIPALTTPSPSMPSFTVDSPGIYVVELIVDDGKDFSEPVYFMVTAATPEGADVFSEQEFPTTSLCAL